MFSAKDHYKSDVLRFGGHMVAVTTIQLCHCYVRADTENRETDVCGYVSLSIYENRWWAGLTHELFLF